MMKLYTPGILGTMKLKNRWIMLAMHTGYAEEDGNFSLRDEAFYKERAEGGAAAITLVGAVSEIGSQDRMHRLDHDRYNEGIRRICDIIHQGDCRVIMQLFHAGRNNTAACCQGRLPLCPSPVPSPIYRTIPKEMTEEEILKTIREFAGAAARCRDCGVDCVEVSASAGYLLSQFFSPLVNQRRDSWGGTAEKRMRFPAEVLKEVRRAVGPDYPVIVKISGGDMLGGYDLQYMIDFLNQLPEGTVDGVTVTGGWHEAPVPQISYHVKPGGFAHLAETVKKGTGLPVIACNRINSGQIAEEILQQGMADFAGAARPFLADPSFARKVEKGEPYNPCQGCNRGCIERVLKYKEVRCAFNPEAGKEYLGKPEKHFDRVLIAGAGPAGLETALQLLRTGCHVVIVTPEKEAGGKLRAAGMPPQKEGILAFRKWLIRQVESAGGTILTETCLSRDLLEKWKPEHVFFAAGAEPVRLKLEGIEESAMQEKTAEEILLGNMPEKGSRIVIAGGGSVGLETAEYLAEKENTLQITVVEMAPKAGKDLGGLRWIVMKDLKKRGVRVMTETEICGVQPGGLLAAHRIREEDGSERTEKDVLPCDLLVYAVGNRPRGALGMEQLLEELGIGFTIVGDGGGAGNIMNCLEESLEAVR